MESHIEGTMTGAEIAAQLAENVRTTGEALDYTEAEYLAYKAMRDRPMSERKAYFGSHKAERMERRWKLEHCSECDAELDEDAAEDYWGNVLCADCKPGELFRSGDPDAYNDIPLSERA